MLQYRENFKLYEKVFAMFMYTQIKPFEKSKRAVTLQIFKHAIYHLS